MVSASGRYVLVFNGEVYNHLELRARLEALGHGFRGRSDTEVLLAAVTEWGARGALDHVNGMFAYALWDRTERLLHLVRDRLGEKPLYYGRAGPAIVFASELKAFRAHPDFTATIDREGLAAFFRYKYVPSPLSIYRGVLEAPTGGDAHHPRDRSGRGPGTARVLGPAADGASRAREPFDGSPEDAATSSTRSSATPSHLRMQADVPLGAFLSGGIDSSTVVAHDAGGRERRRPHVHDRIDRRAIRRVSGCAAGGGPSRHAAHGPAGDPREALDVIPRSPRCSTSRSRTPPRSRPSWCRGWLASTSRSRCRATAGTSSSAATTATGGCPGSGSSDGRIPRPVRRAAGRAMMSASPTRLAAAVLSIGSASSPMPRGTG